MCSLYKLLRPLLFLLDPETAHSLTIQGLRWMPPLPLPAVKDPVLHSTLWGLKFANPVGMAAGFDKNAQVPGAVLRLGFSHTELGTVTPQPQEGNPKPRIFRNVKNNAVINRMGFPGGGVKNFRANLERYLENPHRPRGIIGINIGMNKDQSEPAADYMLLIRTLGPLADYLCVNISSPNTPGLRDLQSRDALTDLITKLKAERAASCGPKSPPLLVKLAPDLDTQKIEILAQTALDCGIDGLVLTNTTTTRPDHLPPAFSAEKGGLSGAPLKDKSLQILKSFYRLTGGKIPLIGVGGISTGADAYARIRAGASLIQLYSALVYEGPFVANSINKQLVKLLNRDGFTSIAQAVGVDHAA
ncbi:MAG: quinone-dependent dihydroorotate dehydrogenase [Alphaproteobacteria bacterium]|nr:quinone-dependent dihydroorotate dehydrogenase [Alphaproteobacteria bacterium]